MAWLLRLRRAVACWRGLLGTSSRAPGDDLSGVQLRRGVCSGYRHRFIGLQHFAPKRRAPRVSECVVSSVIAIAFAIAALLLAFLVVGDAFDEGE